MYVASWCCKCFCVVLCVSFCTGHFAMVPFNLKYLHCLQHSSFEHLFNLLYNLLGLVFIACVAFVKCRPVLHYCVIVKLYLSSPSGSWIVCSLQLKKKYTFRSCDRGYQLNTILYNHWWAAAIKSVLLFFSCRPCLLRTFLL